MVGGGRWPVVAYLGLAASVLVIALAGIVLPNAMFGRAEPPRAGRFSPPTPDPSLVVLEVVQAGEQGVVLSDPAFSVPGDLPLERLEPAAPSELSAGDDVIVIAVPNEVRNFALTAIVIHRRSPPAAGVPPTSELGFAGHEPAQDRGWAPVLWGTVTGIEGQLVGLATPAGEATLELGAGAPLLTPRRIAPAELVPGDRIAIRLEAGQPVSAIALAGELLHAP